MKAFFAKSFRLVLKSEDLFLGGLLMMGAFLFNPSTILRTIQFLLFWLYARLAGKKNNTFITIMIMLGIIFFNLLVPYGKILVEWGAFRITQGSLLSGLHKAVTLEGLIMLSKACIRPDLRLPGAFGSLLGESFRIFERITDRKFLITRKRLINGIDQLMLELSAEQEMLVQSAPETQDAIKSAPLSILLLLGAMLPILGLTIAGLFRVVL